MDVRKVSALGDGFDARDVQSSPIPPHTDGREDYAHRRRSSAFGRRNTSEPKGMGMREMEQYIQKITKENFDLKLELFHRRQRHEKLEAEIEKLQHLEEDNQELQSVNEELSKELEKRDEAVKEAVNLICELEAKVESMNLLGSKSPNLSTPRRPTDEKLPALPDLTLPVPTKGLWRTPSFFREDKPSTAALRSLYQSDQNPSTFSLNRAGSPQRSADPDTFTLNSPRLSVLSESSFMSVYGKSPKLSPKPTQDLKVSRSRTSTDGMKPPRRRQSHRDGSSSNNRSEHRDSSSNRSEQLSKWLEESVSTDESSPLRHRSGRKPRRSSARLPANDQFSSISEVLHKPRPHNVSRNPPLPNLAKPIFNGPEVLPPTPDTMSTAQKASSSTQSIIAEKSLNDTGRPSKYVSPLLSADDGRPYTSGSLGLEFENDVNISEDEHHSVHVEQSEADTNTVPPDAFDSFPFMGAGDPSKAMRVLGREEEETEEEDAPSRPPLSTKMGFNGESNGHSRALSYPTPISSAHRTSSFQTSTPSRPPAMRTTTSPLSPHREWRSPTNSSATPTPSGPGITNESLFKSPPMSPTRHHAAAAVPAADLGPASRESKLPRTTTSSRLKTLFRRSNSHATNPAQVLSMLNGGAAAESKIARPVSAEGQPGGAAGAGLDRSKSGRGAFLGRKG